MSIYEGSQATALSLPQYGAFPKLIKKISFYGDRKVILSRKVQRHFQAESFLALKLKINGLPLHLHMSERDVQYFCRVALGENVVLRENSVAFCEAVISELLTGSLAPAFQLRINIEDSSLVSSMPAKGMWEIRVKHQNVVVYRFFFPLQDRPSLLKLCKQLGFLKLPYKKQLVDLSSVPFVFPVEVGVTALTESQWQQVEIGDIILFDKTTIKDEFVTDVVINAGTTHFKAKLENDDVLLISQLKEW